MAAAKTSLFRLSPEELVRHVDGASRVSSLASFRGRLLLLNAVLLGLSWCAWFVLFPALGMQVMEPADFALTAVPYAVLMGFALFRHRWAYLALAALFALDHLSTPVLLALQMGQGFHPGSVFTQTLLVLYCSSLAWKAFLVEREIKKRTAVASAPLVQNPPSA